MDKVKQSLKILFTFMLDPPGWIPAWVLTGALLVFARIAAHGQPQTLEVFRILSNTYQVVLGIWLGYKGLKALPDIVAAWRVK